MPYIKQEDRFKFEDLEDALSENPAKTAGELNYLFSRIINEYLRFQGFDYQHINDCIGALEGAKLELYRRLVGPYEDIKIRENGDVF